MSSWSEDEVSLLKAAYGGDGAPVDLVGLSASLGRDKSNVCRKARGLGLTNQKRRKVHERKLAKMFSSKEELRQFQSKRQKEYLKTAGHPRGYLGMRHTQETKEKISAMSKAAWSDPSSRLNSPAFKQAKSDKLVARIVAGEMRSGYSRSRGGRRDDLGGVYFRSAWEANYARYLNMLVTNGDIAGWEFEPKTFEFATIKRGTRAYTPDFRVVLTSGKHEWHEVKGWMDAKSKTRLARFKRYYPEEKLIVVDQVWFKSANRTIGRMLPNWEHGTVHAKRQNLVAREH